MNTIKNGGNELLKEKLGLIIKNDIESLPRNCILRSELNYLKSEWLGYNFLDQTILKQIAILKRPQDKSNYEELSTLANIRLINHINDIEKE